MLVLLFSHTLTFHYFFVICKVVGCSILDEAFFRAVEACGGRSRLPSSKTAVAVAVGGSGGGSGGDGDGSGGGEGSIGRVEDEEDDGSTGSSSGGGGLTGLVLEECGVRSEVGTAVIVSCFRSLDSLQVLIALPKKP